MKKNNPSALLRDKHNGSRLNGDGVDSKQLLSALSAIKRGDFSARPVGSGNEFLDGSDEPCAERV